MSRTGRARGTTGSTIHILPAEYLRVIDRPRRYKRSDRTNLDGLRLDRPWADVRARIGRRGHADGQDLLAATLIPLPGPWRARVPGCLPAGRPGVAVRLRPASSAPVVPDQPGRPGPAGSEPVRMPGAAGIQCPQLPEARDPQLANHDPARRRAHVGQGGEAHPAGETGDRDLGPGLPAVGRAAVVITAARDGGTANPATSPATGTCPVIEGATTWSNMVAYRFGGTWA